MKDFLAGVRVKLSATDYVIETALFAWSGAGEEARTRRVKGGSIKSLITMWLIPRVPTVQKGRNRMTHFKKSPCQNNVVS